MKNKIFLILLIAFGSFTSVLAQYTKLLDFNLDSTGRYPYYGSLYFDGTYLYGATSGGGDYNGGTIIKIKPDGTGYSKILDFEKLSTGYICKGSLISDGEYLYGAASSGGVIGTGFGTLFKIKFDGSGFEKLWDFEGGALGQAPIGGLFYDGEYLYGMTSSGGAINLGVIYKIKPDGSAFSIFKDFEFGSSGFQGNGELISDGTYLFGMTVGGGDGNLGTVFKVKKDGSDYTVLMAFTDDPNGAWGYGSLVTDGTYLYGMGNNGGEENRGVIFKIKMDGSDFFKLLDFDDVNGAQPLGSLILDGSTLYGMAELGGTNFLGTLFQIQTDGTDFNVLLDFNGEENGSYPYGTLTYVNGAFCGMTNGGGINDYGTIFRYGEVEEPESIDADINENLFQIYPNPIQNTLFITNNTNAIATFSITTITGQLLYSADCSGNTQIDMQGFSSGVYLVSIYTENGVVAKVVMKE